MVYARPRRSTRDIRTNVRTLRVQVQAQQAHRGRCPGGSILVSICNRQIEGVVVDAMSRPGPNHARTWRRKQVLVDFRNPQAFRHARRLAGVAIRSGHPGSAAVVMRPAAIGMRFADPSFVARTDLCRFGDPRAACVHDTPRIVSTLFDRQGQGMRRQLVGAVQRSGDGPGVRSILCPKW
jgi:hypothetical protein